eukprot:s226_g30.t1
MKIAQLSNLPALGPLDETSARNNWRPPELTHETPAIQRILAEQTGAIPVAIRSVTSAIYEAYWVYLFGCGGADHYGRFDLPAFHLLVAPMTLEQLQRASQQSPPLQVDVTDVDVAAVDSPWDQSPSQPSPSASPTSPEVLESPGADGARRNALMVQLFNALDSDGDGRCSSKDLAMVFAARYEAWPMHFRKLCSHWKVKQREGVDAQTFAEMLEERGELGLYVSEDDLETMISSIRQPRVERRVSIQDRSRLIDALFFYLDSNQDGLLDQTELQVLAKELKVEVSQDFQAVDLDAFREMVNDGGQCLYCDDSSLPSLLARFSRKG